MRARLLVLLLVPALLLAGCGDDDDGEVTADAGGPAATEGAPAPTDAATEGDEDDTTSTDDPVPATVESPCVDLDVVVLDQVEDPGPVDDRPEGAPPSPEEVAQGEEAVTALQRLAAEGPEELRADAALVADVYGIAFTDPDAVTDEQETTVDGARQRLLDWAVQHCPVDGPVWSCARRGTFRLVGAPIDGPTPPPVGERPEDVVGGVDVEPGWRMVEVVRTAERATFAWLAADGLAVRSQTAVAVDDDDWRSEQTSECDTFDAPVDGSENGDEGFAPAPPASSTSIP